MKFSMQYFVLAIVMGSVSSEVLQTNPLQKVVQLLSDMEAKIKTDGDNEAKAYEQYSAWCTSDAREKGFDVQTATAEIEDLSAAIAKATIDASTETSRKEGLASAIASDQNDLEAATKIRKAELADFTAVEAGLTDTIDTLDRAINVLSRSGSALLQATNKNMPQMIKALSAVLDAASVSTKDKSKLIALTQNAVMSDDDELNAPAAVTYKSHSGNIIDVLEDLHEKASTQLADLRKEEVNSKHNFQVLKQSLEDQTQSNTKEMAEAKSLASAAAGNKASAQKGLVATKKDLEQTQTALAELKTSCANAAADNKVSTNSRNEELQALAAAKAAIIEKTKGAETVVYGTFFQMNMNMRHEVQLASIEIVTLLRQTAKRISSGSLAQLANRIGTVMRGDMTHSGDRFGKVKGLITDLLKKLQDEAGADASHKAFCDKETANTKEKIDILNRGINKLTAHLNKNKALSDMLKGEAVELSRELAELAKSQAEIDHVRVVEHGVFTQTKADLEKGLEGARLAIKILREYYGSTSFMEQPGTHEKATDSVTGVLGMLEVVESDLGKSLAECVAMEDTATGDHTKISHSNAVTKTSKEQDLKYKTSEADALDRSVAALSADTRSTQAELDAVFEYKKGIDAACVVKPETYEGRRARREAEIAGLKQALAILDDQAALGMLQKRGNGLRGTSVSRHW